MSLNGKNISLSALLEQAQPLEIEYDGLDMVSYPTSVVEAYLPQNIKIIEVTVSSGDICYITYGFNGTHTLVYLVYSLEEDSIWTLAVRDMDADTRVTFSDGEKRVEESLTKGNKNTYQGLHMDSRYFFAAQVFAVLFSLRALYLCIVACANINSQDVSTGEKRRKRFFISQALLYFCEFLILPIIYILNFHIIIWGILVFLISLLQVIMLKYHKS